MSTVASTRTTTDVRTGSTYRSLAGGVITTLVTLFLGFDAITHVIREAHVVEANAEFGAPTWFPVVCGVVLASLLVGYHVPATRAMAVVLITAYLGGAIAANLMTEQPLANTGFAIVTALFVWAGAWPRDARLRALVRR